MRAAVAKDPAFQVFINPQQACSRTPTASRISLSSRPQRRSGRTSAGATRDAQGSALHRRDQLDACQQRCRPTSSSIREGCQPTASSIIRHGRSRRGLSDSAAAAQIQLICWTAMTDHRIHLNRSPGTTMKPVATRTFPEGRAGFHCRLRHIVQYQRRRSTRSACRA